MYKRDGIFFFFFFLFVTTWTEKIDKMSANAFSHSKRTAALLVALCVVINKLKERLMPTCDGGQAAGDGDGMLDCTSVAQKHLRPPALFLFSLKDAIEGFFDKVANSTKK